MEKCLQELKFDQFPSEKCLRIFISKGLSAGILAGSLLVKVPQILKIVGAGSSQGLSVTGYLLESISIVIAFIYNYRSEYPFSTYGEGLFLVLQNLIIISLIFSSFGRTSVTVAGIASLCWALFICPMDVLSQLQVVTIFIGVISRFPQIVTNFRNKSAGQLSIITVFLQFAGMLARVFTTLQEVNDPMLLNSAIINAVLNGVLFVQVVGYGSAAVSRLMQTKPKPKKKRN